MALMVLKTCEKIEGGMPNDVRFKMVINICLDFGVRLVPFVGDIVDTFFRCNTRNAIVLEKFLRKRGAENLKKQGQAVVVDPTDPEEYDRHLEEVLGPPPHYTTAPPTIDEAASNASHNGRSTHDGEASNAVHNGRSTQHMQAKTPQAKPSGSWFGGFRNKTPQADPERGTHTQTRQDEILPNPPSQGTSRNKPMAQKSRH